MQDYAVCKVCGLKVYFDPFTKDGKPRFTSAPHTWENYTCPACQKESEQTISDFEDHRGESGSWESMTEYFESLAEDSYQ